MKEALALLFLLPVVLASVTVTLHVQDGKVALQNAKVVVPKPSITQYTNNVVKGTLSLNDEVYSEQQGSVTEKISMNSNVLLKNSLIKRGQATVTFTIMSNPSSAEATIRLKGSALIALFYVRNMDITVKTVINKNKGIGNSTITGFVELPAPQVTVNNLLKVMIPKIKKQISKAGLTLVKLDYKVRGKKIPPISKVDFTIVLSGSEKKILQALSALGIPSNDFVKLVNINDTATRKIDGTADILSSLKRVNNTILTVFNVNLKAEGHYYNTTVSRELRMRLKPILQKANVTKMLNYLLSTNKFSMSVTAETNNSVVMLANFKNIYFKNTKSFWNLVYMLQKKYNINFKVICNGKTLPVQQAITCTG